MHRLVIAALVCVATIPAQPLHAGAKKPPKIPVRFHGEGNAGDGESFSQPIELIGSKKQIHMQKMELISEGDIRSYEPFAAIQKDGTFGVYFQLDDHGRNIISQYTMSKKGTYVLAFIGGRHVIDLYVDRGVNDGILTIPRGLSPAEIAALDQAFPRMGQEGQKRMPKPQRKAEAVPPKPTPTPPKKNP
jgi:hypothetical protein